MAKDSGSGNDSKPNQGSGLWAPSDELPSHEGVGMERHLKEVAKHYAKALEWKTDGPLEVQCDFVGTVEQVLRLASSTGNSAGLILVDPGRPMRNIPGATLMGPDLEAALNAGEVRESFGVLPTNHFAVAVIGCSEEDLKTRSEGLLKTCKAAGARTRHTNKPPRLVALHIPSGPKAKGEVMLKHAQHIMEHFSPGQEIAVVSYLSGTQKAAD